MARTKSGIDYRREVQQQIIDKKLKFYVVDALKVARETEMGVRINTIMQTCFFALAECLASAIRPSSRSSRRFGRPMANGANRSCAATSPRWMRRWRICTKLQCPTEATSSHTTHAAGAANGSSDFVQRVTAMLLDGQGDLLPVSALPVDGTFPTDTAKVEKRSIAHEIPIWDPGHLHRVRLVRAGLPARGDSLQGLSQRVAQWRARRVPVQAVEGQRTAGPLDDDSGRARTIARAAASASMSARPRARKSSSTRRSTWSPSSSTSSANGQTSITSSSCPNWTAPRPKLDTVKGSQLLEPLFEFSGACAGCGETPYLKLMSQLFGDRALDRQRHGLLLDLRRQPADDALEHQCRGRGPAWNNSLFEDNAEFGLGLRLAVDQKREYAEFLLRELASVVGDDLVERSAGLARKRMKPKSTNSGTCRRAAKNGFVNANDPAAGKLAAIADVLVNRSVWIVGGDGWAYDIGFGGLDHVLTTGRDVNILVLDTGVYSNTGGQASKATPRAAVAKFAAAGKPSRKKDLGMLAVSYGNVYVAQIAMGSNPAQTVRALPRSRILPWSVADPGVQPLHRSRHRHDDRHDPSEGHRANWLLATVPLRPTSGPRRRASIPSGQPQAEQTV